MRWLDPGPAVAPGFVASRLDAERVVLLFAVRELTELLSALSGLPELPMGGLGDREAVDLLSSITGGRLSPGLAGPVREASGPGWY
jgi:hypothetical protein